MIRLFLYALIATFIALFASWVFSNPGQIFMQWQDWEIRLTFALFIVLLIFYTAFILFFDRFIRWLKESLQLNSPKRLARKRELGQLELDQAWSLLVLDDFTQAVKLGKSAQSKLGTKDTNVLRLLASATKYMKGGSNPYMNQLKQSKKAAIWVYKQDLDDLIAKKSWGKALNAVESMLDIYPKNSFLLDMKFSLYAKQSKWNEAAESLAQAHKVSGTYTQPRYKHLKAVIDYCRALEEKAGGRKAESLELARSAIKNDPEFIAANLFAARLFIERNERKSAEKILGALWALLPNFETAQLLIDLYPTESSTETFRRIKKLTDPYQNSVENNHLIARVAIEANHWPEAKKALERNISSATATKTTYQLLASLEQQQKKDNVAVSKYMKLSEAAPVDTYWACNSCLTHEKYYLPLCPACGEFDSIGRGP